MLSRVADSLYWMSRYLERAENTARVLDINLHVSIDQSARSLATRWHHVADSLDSANSFGLAGSNPENFSKSITFDTKDPRSILSCVFSARRNAREIREQISVEMWEELNRIYLSVAQTDAADRWELEAHEFLNDIVESARLFRGLTDSTMSHNEGWHFIQLGQFIERTMHTVNLLDAHFAKESVNAASTPVDDYLEWVSLLKSCAVFGAYCRVYTVNVQAETVAEFLLLDPESPHSVRFGADMIGRALDAISTSTGMSKRSELFRITGKLTSGLSFDSIDEIFRNNLHAYLAEIRGQGAAIHNEVYNACISYPVETAARS